MKRAICSKKIVGPCEKVGKNFTRLRKTKARGDVEIKSNL